MADKATVGNSNEENSRGLECTEDLFLTPPMGFRVKLEELLLIRLFKAPGKL